MAKRFLVDTDVIIEYLRGRKQAVEYLESLEGVLHVSAVTVAELYSGVRDQEQGALEQFLSAFDVVAVDQTLARSAGLCRKSYQPAYGTGLADAIVAMSAEAVGATLLTFNRRHYPMVDKEVITILEDSVAPSGQALPPLMKGAFPLTQDWLDQARRTGRE